MKTICVKLFGKDIGSLRQNDTGNLEFVYQSDAARSLSISLPNQKEVFEASHCVPYFSGLLPESAQVRTLIGKRYGVSPHNIFSLLQSIGHDCAGAVSFHGPEDEGASSNLDLFDGRILSVHELKALLMDLPKRPLLTDVDGLRLSLAGVQDKAALCYEDGVWMIPHGTCPTTHILKTAIAHLPSSIINEHTCLKIASAIGLEAAETKIVNVDGMDILLIKRYDRVRMGDRILRLHQEDFCQALSILPEHKYENEGGPSTIRCFQLLQYSAFPGKDRLHFLMYFIFNILIGNKDAHGKNYSFLYNEQYQPILTPLYDTLCTDLYPDLTPKMSMKIGGQYRLQDVYRRHWIGFCNELNIAFPLIEKLIFDIAEKIHRQLHDPSFEIRERDLDFWKSFVHHIQHQIDGVVKRMQ